MDIMNSKAVIDVSKLDYFDDQVFMDQFIDIFEDSAEDLLVKLEKSLINQFDKFKNTVHSIKGLSGNVRAHRLREMTTKVECLSQEEYRKNAFKYSKEIIDELLKVRKELAKCSSKNKH